MPVGSCGNERAKGVILYYEGLTSLEKSVSQQHIYQMTDMTSHVAHMDHIIQQHRIPDHDIEQHAHLSSDTAGKTMTEAIQLALSRPVAIREIPPRTGLDWTDEVNSASYTVILNSCKEDSNDTENFVNMGTISGNLSSERVHAADAQL